MDTDIAIQVLRLHCDRVDAWENPLYYETLCGIIDLLDGQRRELEAYRSALPLGEEDEMEMRIRNTTCEGERSEPSVEDSGKAAPQTRSLRREAGQADSPERGK